MMGQQPIPLSALERRRRQLLTADTPTRATLAPFERGRQRIEAGAGKASREGGLQLQREIAARGGLGGGAAIKLRQQMQQQIDERKAEQLADLGAKEEEAIRQERLAREGMQLQGLEAERGREFKKGLFDVEQEFKREVFDVEQEFKREVFDFEKDTKLKMLDFEKEKFQFDKETAIFNKVMAAMSLPDDRETNRILGNMYADPNTPEWLRVGLSVYRAAALDEGIPFSLGPISLY